MVDDMMSQSNLKSHFPDFENLPFRSFNLMLEKATVLLTQLCVLFAGI